MTESNHFKKTILGILCLILGGCKAANPKVTDLFSKNGGVKLSTKQSVAMAAGTTTSGAYKIKFSMGNIGANPAQSYVSSGVVRVRPSTAGVLREQ